MTSVRWGIIGTANIARRFFLPAVREAGGEAAAVAGRDPGRTMDNGYWRNPRAQRTLQRQAVLAVRLHD